MLHLSLKPPPGTQDSVLCAGRSVERAETGEVKVGKGGKGAGSWLLAGGCSCGARGAIQDTSHIHT